MLYLRAILDIFNLEDSLLIWSVHLLKSRIKSIISDSEILKFWLLISTVFQLYSLRISLHASPWHMNSFLWFKVLTECTRTSRLHSLLSYCNQVVLLTDIVNCTDKRAFLTERNRFLRKPSPLLINWFWILNSKIFALKACKKALNIDSLREIVLKNSACREV